MDYAKESLRLHEEWKGKIEVVTTVPVETKDDLSLAYTPGVAQPCLEIQKDVNKSYDLTRRWNMCLVVTDGSAVLGLGDIGPEAGMPVMEGKCVLFKAFGDVDAFPLCIKSQDVDEIVNTIYLISGSFGGVNLEDISAPRCFEIEKKLKEKCDIPIFHDDQHGTAIITLAGLTNALKVVGKKKEDVRIIMNGAGAAAISIARLLLTAGFKNITLCDRKGAIYEGRTEGMNPVKEEMSKVTNPDKKSGSLAEMLVGADVFIGVLSLIHILNQRDIRELQLAKAAIAAGIQILCQRRGIQIKDIGRVLIAGAFGNYLDPASACAIGMLPPELEGRIVSIGNAAGEGARIAALNCRQFERSRSLAKKTEFVELALDMGFQEVYVDEMGFPEEDD